MMTFFLLASENKKIKLGDWRNGYLFCSRYILGGLFRWGEPKFRRDVPRCFFWAYKFQYVCHCLQKRTLNNEFIFHIKTPLPYQGVMKLRSQVITWWQGFQMAATPHAPYWPLSRGGGHVWQTDIDFVPRASNCRQWERVLGDKRKVFHLSGPGAYE